MPQPVPVSARTTRTRIGVVGAGSVGSSPAYTDLIRGTAQEVAAYDPAGDRVRAGGLDHAHGAMFTPASRVTASGEIAVLADSDVVFVPAGAEQKRGRTRMDLAGTDAAVLETPMPRLVEQAPGAVLRDERTALPVSTVLEDYRGISGVALSVPSVVARHGVVEQLVVPMDEREVALLRRSAEAIRGTLASTGH